jgi:hypothetical protein
VACATISALGTGFLICSMIARVPSEQAGANVRFLLLAPETRRSGNGQPCSYLAAGAIKRE